MRLVEDDAVEFREQAVPGRGMGEVKEMVDDEQVGLLPEFPRAEVVALFAVRAFLEMAGIGLRPMRAIVRGSSVCG